MPVVSIKVSTASAGFNQQHNTSLITELGRSPLQDQYPHPGTAAERAPRCPGIPSSWPGSGRGCLQRWTCRGTCAAAGGFGERSVRRWAAGRGCCHCWTTPPGPNSGWTLRCSHCEACWGCHSMCLWDGGQIIIIKLAIIIIWQVFYDLYWLLLGTALVLIKPNFSYTKQIKLI